MKRLLPTLLGLCCIADASAQLKVQSVLPHGAAPEKTAPAVYDSTANIRTGGDAAYYESLVGQRRKMIRNSLKSVFGDFGGAEHPFFTRRAEQLGVAEFVELTNWVSRFSIL